MGVQDIIMCDSKGSIYKGRIEGMNSMKEAISEFTNKDRVAGTLHEVIKGPDLFVGVSVANAVTPEMVQSMNEDAIIFAMANPVPEKLCQRQQRQRERQ
jgi:malate dehydrogenase (oxaloacetate-decarboxylating)